MPASDPGPLRLALIGEAPGADECALGYPFAGKSGWLLNQWLASAGVSRSQVFTGNVSQMRPSPDSNDFNLLEWSGPEVQEGIAVLREDLARFRPNIVVALGNAALHLLRHGNAGPPKSAKLRLFQWTSHVGTWRGSLFLGAQDFDPFAACELRFREGRCPLNMAGGSAQTAHAAPGTPEVTSKGIVVDAPATNTLSGQPSYQKPNAPTSPAAQRGASAQAEGPSQCIADPPAAFKCLATYHPAATFREPSFTFPLVSDLRRAVAEAQSPLLELPPRRVLWGLPVEEVEARCSDMRRVRLPIGFDIEGGLGGLQCCSFATSPDEAFVIDLMGEQLERPRVLAAIASVLEDESVPKILWNAAYERVIMEATSSIVLRGYEDPMLAWWERFSELPKGLDYVASILTREPYWADGIGWDRKTGAPKVTGPRFWTYNGLDSMLALEIWQNPLIQAIAASRTPVAFTV